MNKKIAAVFVLSVFFAGTAWAAQIPGRTNFLVNDYAGVLEPAAKAQLEKTLDDFKKSRRIELIVTTVSSTEGMDPDTFMKKYAKKWRWIWPFESDRRVHIALFVREKNLRIGVGRVLEKQLPPAEVRRIIVQLMVPELVQKRYTAAVNAGVKLVIANLENN